MKMPTYETAHSRTQRHHARLHHLHENVCLEQMQLFHQLLPLLGILDAQEGLLIFMLLSCTQCPLLQYKLFTRLLTCKLENLSPVS